MKATDTPRVDFQPGDIWMPHRELAVGMGAKFVPSCDGQVVFDHVANGKVEASCDRCQFTVTARTGEVARSLEAEEPSEWWKR